MEYPKPDLQQALEWSASKLGSVELISDNSKAHGGRESITCRLHSMSGYSYLKIHQTSSFWQNEVHAYERWAPVFGDRAPRLLGVHDEPPLALLLSELPGRILEDITLPPAQERAIWRAAGAALVSLHNLETGPGFGPCLRDGTPAETGPQDPVAYISRRMQSQIDLAIQRRSLNDEELATVQAAFQLAHAFIGERPLPCHRDYCAANWLVDEGGNWAGVIDFEFAHWDLRVADLTRDPNWAWIRRPDLVEAFFEGYGRSFTPEEEQQLLFAHAEFALSAILWGHEHTYYIFEQEGRDSLARLALKL